MVDLRALLTLTLTILVLAAPASADGGRRRAVRAPGAELEVFPLSGHDPTAPADDLEALRLLAGDAKVVALGESYHTSGGFYRMKHRIFGFLVEELGFRAFAMESNWEQSERTDAYVQSCDGTAEEAAGWQNPVWHGSELADLLRWMCEWNRTHPDPADRLTFFGFDIQQPYEDGPDLVAFLETIGIPQTDPRSNGLRSCENAFGVRHPFGQVPPERHAACLQALDALELHLEANREDVVRRTSEETFTVAMLRVRGLRANERQVFTIAHDYWAGFNYRDVGMAEAFHVQRALHAPEAKTVIWAANIHVSQQPAPRGEVPMGSFLEADLGADYVSFALTAYDAAIDYPGFGCGSRAPAAGSVEERLNAHGHEALLARPRGGGEWLETVPMGIDLVRPWRDYDGVIFLRHSPKMHPLFRQPCG